MKKQSILFFALLAAVSCQKENTQDIAPVFDSNVELRASFDEQSSRIATEDGLTFSLEEGKEQIGVYINLGDTPMYDNVLYTAGSADEQGWISFSTDVPVHVQSNSKFFAYAPYSATTVDVSGSTDGGAIEPAAAGSGWNGKRAINLPDLQEQPAAGVKTDIAKYYSVVAAPATPVASDVLDSYSVNLQFSGVFALVRFGLNNFTEGEIKVSKLVFSAENAALTGYFSVDLTHENPKLANTEYAPEAVAGKTFDKVTVTLAEPATIAAQEMAEVYAVVNACAVTAPKLTVYATDAEGKDIVFEKTLSDKTFSRQQRTAIGVKLENPIYEEAGPVICNGESYETIADAVAANTDATEITLKAGTFTLPNDLKNLTINGREGTEINIENANPSRYSDVVFNNITFNVGQNSYHGFQHAGNITFNKCTINGLLFGYGSHEIYNECVFNNPTGEYCMWTYGANADYTGCVFNGNGKFLHVYNEGSADLRTINIKNCKFVSTAKNKAAVNVKSSCGDTHLKFNVNIDNCTTEGEFPEANGGLWACDNKFFDTVSIKVDGTEVYKKEMGPVICNGESYETIADAVAANTDATEITLKAGTFTLPNDLKNLTINGREGTEINIENANPSRYSDVVFNNITFNVGQNSYHGFQHAGNITFNKCTINGLLFGYGSHEIYNECVFNNPTGEYCMWTYGANADYTGCVFNGNGKFLHVYNEGSADLRTINIKDCKFVSTAKNKAAVNVKSTSSGTHLQFNVNIDNCTTEGEFPEANGGLWACDNVFFDTVSIKVDGTEVYLDYKEVDGGYEIYSAKGLQWLAEQVNGGNNFSGKTITLTADIDLDGIDWRPIGNVTSYPGITFAGTFDGGEHTISNLTTSDNTTAHASAGLFGSITGKVRNLKLENVNVSSSHYAGAIVGYSSAGVGMEISNCHVNGGTIVSSPEAVNGGHDNGDKVGGIIGYTVAGNVVKGCSVSNITVSGYRDIGGIAGGSAANVSNCTATAVTIVQDNTNAYKNERITTYKSIIGRDLGGTKTGNTASNMTYCIKNLTTTDALSFSNASVAESGSTFILDGVSVQSVTINGAAKIDTFTVKNSVITAAETNPGGPARFGFFIAPNTTDVLTVNVENTIFNSSWSHAIYAQILGNENFKINVSGCNFSNWGRKETAETDKATSACLKILNAPGITETETERTNYKKTFLSANTWTKPEATYTVINLTDKDNVEHCFSE